MNIIGMRRAALAATITFFAAAAWAWNIQEDHGNYALIRCGDGSNATVNQGSDGNWTVTSPGKNGKVGGSFPIIGKAALWACGE